MKLQRRIFATACCALIAINSCMISAFSESATNVKDIYVSYDDYRESNSAYAFGKTKWLTVDNIAKKSQNAKISNNVNSSNTSGVIIPDDGYATWKFSADKNCSYSIKVKYMSAENSSGNMELELNIDGKIPYSEVATAIACVCITSKENYSGHRA